MADVNDKIPVPESEAAANAAAPAPAAAETAAAAPAPEAAAAATAPAADTPAAPEASPAAPGGPDRSETQEKARKKAKRRKLFRRVRLAVILLVIAAVAGYFIWKKFNESKGPEQTAVTDFVSYGSISATVEGSGLAKAKDSETLTATAAGTVTDVFVAEGDYVEAGAPLYVISSTAADEAVEKARENVKGYEKTLNQLLKDVAGLNLSPEYSGKLLDCAVLNPGDEVSRGQVLATLADDTKLRLEQYYSYAYEGKVHAGQSVEVSIPALMSVVTGTIEKVNMVERITPEGSKLFSAEIVVTNPGTLTDGMAASAVGYADGEPIYPYENGTLKYYRTGELKAKVGGKVISSELVNYKAVKPGQVLVRIDGEDSETEIFNARKDLEKVQDDLKTAEENLAKLSPTAPISGTVMSLGLQPGQEVTSGTAAVTISDTKTIVIDAMVDERNISYVKPGMSVDIDQWGNTFVGTVDSVSLTSKAENGVASYPMVILVDNEEGLMNSGSYVEYSLIASQNDNCLVVPIQCVQTVALPSGEPGDVVFVAGDRPENAIELDAWPENVPTDFWCVPVEIGISDDYNVEIRAGLEEGQEVFTQMQTTEAWM